MNVPQEMIDRFLLHLPSHLPATECWEYPHLDGRGYGVISIGTWPNRITVKAHRLSFEVFNGCQIPEGFEVDHECSNKACANPFDLEAVTPGENARRAWERGERKSCDHPSYEKVVIPSTGSRRCRACNRERQRRYDRQKRESR